MLKAILNDLKLPIITQSINLQNQIKTNPQTTNPVTFHNSLNIQDEGKR